MSREYAIESSKLPLSIRGTLSQPAVRGVYLEELPDSVSDTSEISSERYSIIEDDLMNVDEISDTSCPFTHSYAAYIYVSEAGTYSFYVRANFGAEATIYDGERGVSTGVTCGAQAESSSVEEIMFDGPGYYKVEVKYFSTGETSPVLELHFGKKASDSASREELPQVRDLYIMRNSNGSASLRGNGTEIRPGHEYPIELHDLDGYYTIYGGTVTVIHPNNTSETYPLEGSSVKIPFVPVENLTVHPFSGCTAEIIVQVSSGGGGCGCGGSGTSQTLPTFTATILPENYREDSAPKCACGCSNPTETGNNCISFSQNIGRTPWAAGAPTGQLFIEEDKPSAAMLTPAVLKYRHVMRRSLLDVSSATSRGYIDVSDGCGETTRYDLSTGRATGLSVTEDSMLASSGSEWVEQFADRSQVVYDSAGQMVRFVTSGGIVLGSKDFGIDIVESSGQIKQIYSIADGLMNVTSVTSSGTSGTFRVDWYSPNAVLSSGTTGYVTSAGANPVKSFQFGGVYQPAMSGRDLRFHLTESRYGGSATYYTGWEYSEEYDSDYEGMNYQGWAMYKGSASDTIQQTELRIITSGENSSANFHVSNVIVSGSCSLADYVSSGGTAFYERNAEVNCGDGGNARVEEYIGSDSDRTEYTTRVSSGYGIGKASRTEDRYGSSAYYEYDSLSRLRKTESPDGYGWLYTSYSYPQTPANGLPDYRPAAIVSSYYDPDDDPEPEYYLKQMTYSYQDDVSVGRSETIIQSANGSALTTERVWYPVAGAVVSGGTRTTALNYSDGRLKTVRNEDGTMTSYSYGAVAVSGMPSSGTIFTESATEGYCSNGAFATLPGKSVRRVNSYNVCGDLVGQERFVCLSNGAFVSIGSDSFQYNLTHQRTSAVFANGQTSSASWNCTGPTSEISVDGVTTTYQYDGLKRCIGKVTSSPNGTITESYTLDHAGNIVQTTVTGGGLSLSSSAIYDQEGRVVSSIDPAGQTTSWEYSYDRRTTSETHADGGEVVTEITQEGMLDTISGTAAVRKHSWYYTSDYILQVREEYEGTGDHWQCTCTDGHGHVVLTEAPSFDYDTIVSASQFYDTLGRHVSTFISGQPGLSKTYDAMGNPLAEILSGGTSIRTTLTNTNFVSSAGAVYQVAVTSTFASNTASGTSTTPIVTSQVTRLYPLNNSIRSEQIAIDARGNSATTSESYNPTSHTHTIVRSYPGISNLESAVQRDGLLLSSVSILGGTTSFAYDGLHRQVAQTDPRGNVTSQVYNSYGQVASVIEPTGAVTTYGYDNMGRMTRVVNALGGTVSYTYNPRGQKLSESGNATYPVEYEYDDDTGKLSAHCLHRNSNTDDRTYYYYDSCTQLLKEKCDANGSSVRYEYNSNGLLSKRTWARTTSNGADLITSYTYNVFGELTSVSYNDTTPNVSFTRDALGREIGRSDGAGSQTTAYNAYGEVTTEKFPLSTNSKATVSRTYDSVGRPKTILLKGTTAAVYTYDAATGRYATVKNNSATVSYSYLDKTNLPSVQTWQRGTSSAFLTVSNTYDAYNRLTLINANSSNQAAYVYDSLGRRTSATLQDNTAWNYSYNQRSEITSAIRKNASNVTQNTMRYQYDTIGNRTSSYEDATSKTYDANCLNQYTEIDVTGGSSVCPLYDDDGNMTQFDSSTYTYDAENRLITAVNGTKRVECGYDALSRRVFKKIYLNNTLSKHERYVYDGMKLLATYNARSSFAKINTFLWQPFGLDVPLIMTYNSTVYGYLVDANKNVLGLFNPSKSRVATYLYGPSGQIISSSGTIAANNPIRFSSEQFDADLGLVYYNYRYYSPELGRWLSRDPSQELNSINLYLFCQNNCIEKYDHLGLWLGETHRNITRSAFSSIRLIEISRSNNCDIIVIGKIKEQLISIVIASNVNTDSGETGKQQEYHYCSQMNWTHLQAIEKYKATLASNVGDLNKILNQKGYLDESKCIDALETLGLLTHMWQDYYAHGVERDDSWFGAQVGTLRGSPDAIDFTYLPVTFGLMGFRGGHGGFFRIINPFSHVEPGDRATDAANRRNQAMIFTRNKLVIYLNKWIKKCKCVYKNMLNVVIVVLWLLTLSYNLNANEIEMKLVKTIESNPTYMSFDEMEKSLILCFIDDENKVKYQEYNIASQKINKINNRVPTGVPKLINKVKFVTECQLYKKDDYGEHQVDKTDLWFFGYSSNIILKKKNTTGYEVVWSMPLGKDRRCECIFRSDSVFPYLLIEDDGQWMIYDSKDKSLIKTIKIVSNVFVHQIYLSEFLDNIVSENKIDDIDFATTIFIPKEDWQKKVKENRLTLPPLLSFFPDDNGFSKNEAKFKFQLLAPYRYEGLCFLDRNTVGMIISIGTRMRLTGETRLLLYHFDKNIIFVNKRITPNMCFSPKRFTPDNIAFSQNGKYLAYCYDKKIYIYQLNQSSKED